jgi:RNA polymerase sigma-70 factor (ECF subfamily)
LNANELIAEAQTLRGELYKRAMTLTRNKTEAEDLMQETYLDAFRGAHLYSRQRGRLITWLMVIMRNAHIDICRGKKKETGNVYVDSFLSVEDFQEKVAEHPSMRRLENPIEMLEASDRVIFIRAALIRMPEELRAVMELKMEGLSYEDIGIRLDEPMKVLYSRFWKARLILRAAITTGRLPEFSRRTKRGKTGEPVEQRPEISPRAA